MADNLSLDSVYTEARQWLENDFMEYLPKMIIALIDAHTTEDNEHLQPCLKFLSDYYIKALTSDPFYMNYSDEREEKLVDMYNQIECLVRSSYSMECRTIWNELLTHELAIPTSFDEYCSIMSYVARIINTTTIKTWVRSIKDHEMPNIPLNILKRLPPSASTGLQYRWWQAWQATNGFSDFTGQTLDGEEEEEETEEEKEELEELQNKFQVRLEDIAKYLEDERWEDIINKLHEKNVYSDNEDNSTDDYSTSEGEEAESEEEDDEVESEEEDDEESEGDETEETVPGLTITQDKELLEQWEDNAKLIEKSTQVLEASSTITHTEDDVLTVKENEKTEADNITLVYTPDGGMIEKNWKFSTGPHEQENKERTEEQSDEQPAEVVCTDGFCRLQV